MDSSYRAAGVDVCKVFLDLAISGLDKVTRLNNDEQGCRQIALQMKKQKIDLVAVESTGVYHRRLVRSLQKAGVPVAVIQPALVRHHAQAKRVLAKTDAIDARMIADYAQQHRPKIVAEHDQATSELRAHSDRRAQLVADRVREQGRLEACESKWVASQIRQSIKRLDQQVKLLDKKIRQMIETDAELAKKDQVLQQVNGVGPVATATLLAYLSELGKVNRQQIAALAGLAPHPRDSGSVSKKRVIGPGRAALRRVLYLCARSGVIHNAALRAVFERLTAAGKTYKVAVIACARRLLVYLNTQMAQLYRQAASSLQTSTSPSGGSPAGA